MIPHLRTLILNLGFFIQIICFLIFMRIMEKYKVFLKKYLFTKICSIFTIVYIISFFIVIYYATFISSIFWIIFIVFFTIYLKQGREKKEESVLKILFFVESNFCAYFFNFKIVKRFVLPWLCFARKGLIAKEYSCLISFVCFVMIFKYRSLNFKKFF